MKIFRTMLKLILASVFLNACGGSNSGGGDNPTPDTTAPIITLNGPASVTLTVGETYNELGATATDNVDGAFAATPNGSVDTSVAATYTITYTATDLAGNIAAPQQRLVVVSNTGGGGNPTPDTIAPVITLNGSSEITLTVGDSYTELGATALDNVDGAFAATVTGTVNTGVAGIYTITYSAMDGVGNLAEPIQRIVTVREVPSVINLVGVDLGEDKTILTNQSQLVNATVMLTGEPGGDGLNYAWSQVSGPGSVSFENPDSKNTHIIINHPGSYEISISVSYEDQNKTDSVVITANATAAGNPGLATRPINAGECIAPSGQVSSGTVKLMRPYPNLPPLSVPVAMYKEPGSNRWFVVQMPGSIVAFEDTPDANTLTQIVDITNQVHFESEMGLLDIAFHPDYVNNGFIYLSYNTEVDSIKYSRVSRFSLFGSPGVLDPGSELVILQVAQPALNHNGGQIHFSPFDGNRLYLGLGDGGGADDQFGNGQNTASLLGSIVRIDVGDGSSGSYSIPLDNPFASGGGRSEIYAWGLRNPWRWSFDRSTGDMWVADVGQNAYEEIDLVTVGNNYGWNQMEGKHCFIFGCEPSLFTPPVAEYDHSGGRNSITGGYVYRGNAIAGLQGQYIFADFGSGEVLKMDMSDQFDISTIAQDGNIGTLAEDDRGELYILNLYSGAIKKIVADIPGESGQIPDQLSDWGCFQQGNPANFSDHVIPYNINALLWSDFADKERFMALPDDLDIEVDSEGRFVYPQGSVLGKHFRLNGELVETRLWIHQNTGAWEGFSYEWNEEGTDASLLDSGKDKQIDGQTWHYPGKAECTSCHTAVATFALGPEVGQLNRNFTYPSSGIDANQLTTLESIGLLSHPVTSDQKSTVFYAIDDPAYSTERRARSYLHANCAGCHQPGGPGLGEIDLRFDTDFDHMRLCNQPAFRGNLGLDNPLLISPGDPDASILMLRIVATNGQRMPPVATSLVDDQAVNVLRDWITSIESCP